MQVSSVSSAFSGGFFGRFAVSGRVSGAEAPAPTAPGLAAIERAEGLRALIARLEDLDETLAGAALRLRRSGLGQRGVTARPAVLVGDPVSDSRPGGGVLPGTAARLRSVGEVNATPTSFTSRGPSWAGASTAPITIGGTYTGTVDTTWRLVASNQTRTIGGLQPINLRVLDPLGAQIGALTIPGGTAPGTTFALLDGLTLTVGAGVIAANDQLSVNVSASVGTDVDPDQPLGGSRLTDPLLEDAFDVVNGSFTVNGVSIAVGVTDTLNDVLDRITASGAGVIATYDPLADEVLLTRDTVGALPITLAGDTSGLLDALKLSAAVLEPGTDPSTSPTAGDLGAEPMANFTALAGVVAGSFTLNGQTISLDPAVDSLDDVLDRMEAAVPGLSASRAGDGSVTLRHPTSLSLGGDSTGLLAVLGLDGATAAGTLRATRGMGAGAARRAAEAVAEVARGLTALAVGFTGDAAAGAPVRGAREGQRSAVSSALSAAGARPRGWGLSLGAPGDGPLEVDAARLRGALRRGSAGLAAALIGEDRRSGLIGDLQARVDAALRGARRALEGAGGGLDRLG